MESNVIQKAKDFLIEYLNGKNNMWEKTHPWRKSWEFAVQHCFRVESYAVKIIKEEASELSLREIEMIRTAAILHDIGRLEHSEDGKRDDHAVVGADVVEKWLYINDCLLSEAEKIQCLSRIRNHSKKGELDMDLGSRIIKDADVLDEIGAMSILMSSNWIDRNSPYFYQEMISRLEGFELDFCEKQEKKLSTTAAKSILKEKRDFIRAFTSQLKLELEGTMELML